MLSQKGFTLIEMLVVLAVISILLLITIPNMSKSSKQIDEKGCEAFVQMVETQVQSYKIHHNTLPDSLQTLIDEGYIKQQTCPDGRNLHLQEDGSVEIVPAP
ncbi:competence protein ComGC [Melghiribacillus thermohalophilus]|uniref:ComG operon protein 3 n=1 Tax=Melghiribacillus thermohalophilus TaxID=1324956 RepID=A0A4R3NBW8_9BACI|nr:competence type IV pilus major pilin ComGC [Melghiribacillus thermohalophilus]TCT26954.1 competence protein ComGC [Melghiribacillus thermohalophilus]